MSRAKGHRQQRRHTTPPRRMVADTMALAQANVQLLKASDVQQQMRIVRQALDEFRRGLHCAHHWKSLADTANMAETLASMGLGGGQEAEAAINEAQQALAAVHQRHTSRGSWTLYAAEVLALNWLVQLHELQLANTSYGEFEAAFNRTRNRIQQALAGNAPAGTIIAGEIHG